MIRSNKKLLLVYAFTVVAFVVFFFVTNRHKPKDEGVMNYIKEMEIKTKMLDQRLMKMEHEPSSLLQKNQKQTITGTENINNMLKKKEIKEDLANNLDKQEDPSPAAATINKEDYESDSTKDEITNYMKLIRQQMSNVNKSFQIVNKWNEYKDQKQLMLKRFSVPLKNPNAFPHIILDNVTLDCKAEYDVIVLVNSHSTFTERRARIRNSWGASQTWLTKKKWKVIFTVGVNADAGIINQLKTESKRYNDILVLDIPEEFYTLSKRLLVSLKWVFQKTSTKFVFKADDSVFIHVDRILEHLGDAWSDKNYIGYVVQNQPPERNQRPFAVTEEEWPGKTYDPFCKGGGFILSSAIIGKMIPYFNWVKPLKIDDAYVGHLVKLAGGRPLHAPDRFLIWNNNCQYDNKFFLSYPVLDNGCRDYLMKKVKH